MPIEILVGNRPDDEVIAWLDSLDEATRSSYRHIPESEGELQAFATDGERIVGYANLRWHYDRWAYDLGYVVHPDYRRQGIATAMIRALEAARDPRFRFIQGEVDADNAASIRVLEKLGYTVLKPAIRQFVKPLD